MNYTIPRYHSIFPGEPYLNLSLPNYQQERQWIIIKLVAAIYLFFVWLPNKLVFRTVAADQLNEFNQIDGALMDEKKGGNDQKQRRRKNAKIKSDDSIINVPSTTEQVVEIDSFKSSLLTTLGLTSIFLILFLSSNNLFPSRRILRAPLFTPQECASIIEMAENAARLNVIRAEGERKELLKKFPALKAAEKGVLDGSKNETEVIGLEGWGELKKVNSLLKCEFEMFLLS